MRTKTVNGIFSVRRGGLVVASALVLAVGMSGCSEPEPRSFAEFMEDRIAREGTLVRCDADRQAAQNDIECANARRAMAVISLRQERERREALERESEIKIEALTREMAERERAAREAALQAAQQEREAYELMWPRQEEAPAEPQDQLTRIELPASLRGQ